MRANASRRMPPKSVVTPSYRSIASSITCSSAFSEQDTDDDNSDNMDMPLLFGRMVASPIELDSANSAHKEKDKAPRRPARQMSVATSSSSVYGEETGEIEEKPKSISTSTSTSTTASSTLERQLLPDDTASSTAHQLFHDIISVQIDSLQKELKEKQLVFQKAVKIRDRKYHFRTYKRCFVGSEAIDIMLAQGLATTREEAQTLGNHFLLNGLFRHVCGEHQFEDGYFFYRFLEDEDGSFWVQQNATSSSNNSSSSSIFGSSNNVISNSNENELHGSSFRTQTIPEEDSQADASGSS